MNDSKFIELLNLFLDREISAEDAKLLEAEVLRSPKRRRLYREYCAMQKACVVLAEQAESESTANVVDFKPAYAPARQSIWKIETWGLGTYAASLCAAAACVALAVVIRNGNGTAVPASQPADAGAIASVRIEAPASTQLARREVPRTISPSPRSSELHPVFTTQSLALTSQQNNVTPAAATVDPRFDWMNQIQVASLQKVSAEDLVFEQKAALRTDTQTFRSRRPIDAQVERAAWQFQR